MPIVPPPPPPSPVPRTPISEIVSSVLSRVQDPTAIFWNLNLEAYSSLVEAINDLMLIVGRPTLVFAQQVTLNPGNVWQPMVPGMLAITNIRSSNYALHKVSLRDMDYSQASWSSSWELDVADVPQRWLPLGLNYFAVHPAPSQPINVQIAGVSYPNNAPWPPTGNETSAFHQEIEQALVMYAEAYLRWKEIGDDAQEGDVLYQQYLDIAKRLTNIEDRRDPVIFSQSYGVNSAASQTRMR